MSERTRRRSVDLGAVEPARSRHAGRRSAVALTDSTAVAGRADGSVLAVDRDGLAERWRWPAAGADGSSGGSAPADVAGQVDGVRSDGASSEGMPSDDGAVVAAEPFAGGVAVGTRGASGAIRLHDADTGVVTWRHEAAADVGEPQRDTRFFLPFVADLAVQADRLYAAVRRYERDGGDRAFESVVYAFTPDGRVDWRYETDASPIALDVRDDRVAVAYNRCTGAFQHGLAVLDAVDGTERWHWDPGTDGQRRVGDVSLVRDGAVVASHGDYRGYWLGDGGAERWHVDLATPTAVGDETLYAYPNHVHATRDGAAFVTGNTYAEEGRETDALHPEEHVAVGVSRRGRRRWTADVGGFAGSVAGDGRRLAIPVAQHFRERDPERHGCLVVDLVDGVEATFDADGVVTGAACDGDVVATVEEPVVYHDDGTELGSYGLTVATV